MRQISKKQIIILVLLICVVGRIAISLLPFDGRYFAGPDHYSHMHNVESVKDRGLVSWDYYWYGGTSFLRFYPPLSYLTAGFLANVMDDFDAYKMVLLLAFSLTPVAAYLLFREFFKKTKELLFATALFSFTVHYASIADAGQFPTVFAIPFSLLFLTFFIKHVKNKGNKSLILASVFLALTTLSHLLVMYTVVLISFIYLLTSFVDRKFEFRKFASSFGIYVIGLLLSSFWIIPTVIESKFSSFIPGFSTAPLYTLPFINILKIYGIYPNFITISVTILGGILLLYGIKKSLRWTGENLFLLASFLVFLAGYMGAYFLFPFANFHYSRWIVLMPIITTIMITKALDRKLLAYLALIFLVSQIFLFLTSPERVMDIEPQQKVAQFLENKEGRTIYLPRLDNTFDYLLPKYNNEGGAGFFPQGLTSTRLVISDEIGYMFLCIGKVEPLSILSSLDLFSKKTTVVPFEECVLNNKSSDELLMFQNVRYIIINDQHPEVVSRFENDSNFTVVKNIGNFTIMELNKSSYIQTNPLIKWSYSKKPDRIEIDLNAEMPMHDVFVRISETWYPNWKSNEVNIEPDNLEFMTFTIPELEGNKHITIEFMKPVYQQVGEGITLIAVIGFFSLMIIKRNELFHLK